MIIVDGGSPGEGDGLMFIFLMTGYGGGDHSDEVT